MKIRTKDKLYVQLKDIELILLSYKQEEIPQNILKVFNSHQTQDINEFIAFTSAEDIEFLDSIWFILNYNEFMDFTDYEIVNYRMDELTTLRRMRKEFDMKQHRYLKEHKEFDNNFDRMLYEWTQDLYLPGYTESKKYPLDFRQLYNKVEDYQLLMRIKDGTYKLNIDDDFLKPISYSKKQLQRIYYEVLGESLSFEELKPIERELNIIFRRIDYTPEIITIIRQLIEINRYNTLEFIQDDMLDMLLKLSRRKTKFQEMSSFVIDYLYAIGYNNFNDHDSKIILERDLKRLKSTIRFILSNRPDDDFIYTLSKYNPMLSELIDILRKIDIKEQNNIKRIHLIDVLLNMGVFVYFRPEAVEYDLNYLFEVSQFIQEHKDEVLREVEYDYKDIYKEKEFVKYFTNSNKILLNLYRNKKDNPNRKLIPNS